MIQETKDLSSLIPMIPSMGTVDTSASEIKTFKRCRIKWVVKYVLKRRKDKTGRALAFGRIIHSALAFYYGDAGTQQNHEGMKEALKRAYRLSVPNTFNDPDKALLKDLYKVLQGYVSFWNPDFNLVVPESDFTRVPVFDHRFAGFMHGRFDGLVPEEDGIWVVDHKSGKKFTPKTYELDPQIDLYSLSGAKLFGKSFKGVVINYIRSYTSKKSLNYVRTKVVRTRSELNFVEENLARTLRMMGSVMPSDLTFSFTKDCTWDCDYLSVCRRLRAGQPIISHLLGQFVLRDREKEKTTLGEQDE